MLDDETFNQIDVHHLLFVRKTQHLSSPLYCTISLITTLLHTISHYDFTTQYLSLPLYYTLSLITTLLHNISYYHFTTQDLICGEVEML